MGMGFKRCKMIKNDTQRCKNLYIVKSVMNGNEKRPTYIYTVYHYSQENNLVANPNLFTGN